MLPLLLLLFADGWRAGAATVDITPPTGHPMWGYAARRDLPSVGVMDKLHARALVLEAGKQRLALVSLDLGRAPTRAGTAAVEKEVRKLGVGTVFLVASHTHNGPILESDAWPTPKAPYTRELEKKLVAVITDAVKALRPARIGTASKEVMLNRNRHTRGPDAPVDRELLVLRVEDEKGKPIAHAVNFAAHPTMISAKVFRFSADYPGHMAALVEKETAAPCLFLQGAAGDLSPAAPAGHGGPEKFGQLLGREVLALAKTIRCAAVEKPTIRAREESFRFAPRVDLTNPVVRAGLTLGFSAALVDFFVKEYKDGVRPRLTTALLDGKIGFVGVSGEVFTSHSLHLKRRARLERLFFLGYCNDYQQYFPTIEAASAGGYGTEFYISPAATGAGERIMDRALIHLYAHRGKLSAE